MLLDSNIIIYPFQPAFQFLQEFIRNRTTCCSAISCVETLGYHRLSEQEKYYLHQFFRTISVLPVSRPIINTAIEIRQLRKISLGDALIAATAMEHRQPLITRNIKDFSWIKGLKIVNPLAED
jgi:predicted nucleic acid-binding protein